LVLVALLAMPSAALAQYGPGSHSGTSTEWTFSGRGALDDLNTFGACFATRQTKDALRLVGTEAGSADEARVYKALFSKEQFCLGNLSGLSAPWKYVRGAVGEGFYHERVPVPAGFAASHDVAPEKVQSFMDAAVCYAARHSADAQQLIDQTKPGTKEEAVAIDALWSNFTACLPPNMPTGFQIENVVLRYRIAEALWRLGVVRQ
jgi:hypothetical protein